MKSLLAATLLVSTVSTTALAGNFEGPFVEGNFLLNAGTTEVASGNLRANGLGQNTYGAALGLGYGMAIDSGKVLLLGGTLDIIQPTIYEEIRAGVSTKIEQDYRFGVYAAPGLVIGKDTLAYAKFSYNRLKAKGSGGLRGDTSFNGLGFGFGAKFTIAPNTHLTFEAQRIMYGSQNNSGIEWKPTQTIGTIGVDFFF